MVNYFKFRNSNPVWGSVLWVWSLGFKVYGSGLKAPELWFGATYGYGLNSSKGDI